LNRAVAAPRSEPPPPPAQHPETFSAANLVDAVRRCLGDQAGERIVEAAHDATHQRIARAVLVVDVAHDDAVFPNPTGDFHRSFWVSAACSRIAALVFATDFPTWAEVLDSEPNVLEELPVRGEQIGDERDEEGLKAH